MILALGALALGALALGALALGAGPRCSIGVIVLSRWRWLDQQRWLTRREQSYVSLLQPAASLAGGTAFSHVGQSCPRKDDNANLTLT